jgi:enoyl-CoA hydratase/carnithine racemase
LSELTLTTLLYEVSDDHVATVTLNRPDRLNSFDRVMVSEMAQVWDDIRDRDDVHAVVLQASGDRAFCSGVDVADRPIRPDNFWNRTDPGQSLGPKARRVWKPVIAAAHGIVAGGAFYWLNEADIVICSADAMFFDPHVSYGMTSAFESIGLARTIALREALRITLLGLHERMSAARALQIGLVSEVLDDVAAVQERARDLASIVAAQPSVAVQGSVKAIWESLDLGREQAIRGAMPFVQMGNESGERQVDRSTYRRPEWHLR